MINTVKLCAEAGREQTRLKQSSSFCNPLYQLVACQFARTPFVDGGVNHTSGNATHTFKLTVY
jgi:hypothetical protein